MQGEQKEGVIPPVTLAVLILLSIGRANTGTFMDILLSSYVYEAEKIILILLLGASPNLGLPTC
jgi:hypothetical protein